MHFQLWQLVSNRVRKQKFHDRRLAKNFILNHAYSKLNSCYIFNLLVSFSKSCKMCYPDAYRTFIPSFL